ncbi:TMV resistance protein N-like isoform X2 [Syzygium oleosum]|uniref:TMV resistance protein N-like isoform X2 n=1 Tax=Syzygium oleosum TaxID=219896 RepID=UPI0024BBE766|nr:TMV resistance protein N-like isoform X2 [Syzygium oleosum]
MANSEARTSIDAAPALKDEYDVFLNFRGEDTRHNFTDFLYDRLVDAGVHVFRDEEKLPVGEEIGGNLLHAINSCTLYIPIFSPTYASSKWCLRELVHIRHNFSESEGQKSIFPIFFHVEPNDIKLKTQLYTEDFSRHEKESPKEVEAWREALAKVDEIKGWKVKKDQSQATIVKLVVEKVLKELKIKQKSVPKHLVGHDDRVNDLTELLDVKQLDVRFIEIYGMGGMGKTTIAKVLFNKLCAHFGKYCSFLEDVRERSTKEGIVQLQKKIISDIGGFGSVEKIDDCEEGMRRIGATLSNKKVLVVLDDVDEKVPIKSLIGNSKLVQGSRIIITTRDKDILPVGGFEGDIHPYEILKMDDTPALQLFCWHAFDRDFPSDDYHERSCEIVLLMEGLPLAIEVVGSLLKGKKEDFWDNMLVMLREEPGKKILDKLKISYDDLEYGEQQIFLDIACFLFNEKKTDATYIWDDCKFFPAIGIDVLTKRCLIKILDNNKLWMHNQLINLGKHIVRQESPSNPGKRSRLWVAEEARGVIKSKERKEEVQGIDIDGLNYTIEIKHEEFERLENLRLLKLGNGTYAADFAECCSKLRWISWHSPHWDLRGDNMYLNHLVVFKLHNASFTDDAKAWDLIKMARNLKVLALTQCGGITTIPDFSKCLSLKRLTLAHCNRLKRIESFIRDIELLIELEIEWCEGLTNLPEEVGALVKLVRFSLRGCSGLSELPSSLGNLTSLMELDLSKTSIAKLPNSMNGLLKLESFLLTDKTMMEFPKFIGKLRSLRLLSLPKNGSYSSEHHVWQLPSGISMLEILEELDLSVCDETTSETPVGIVDLSCFRILNLTSTQICEIPRNIDVLHHLQALNLRNCHEIQESSELPSRTNNMLHQHASSPPELDSLSRLDLKTDGKLSSSLLRLDLLCSSFKWADLLPSSLILRNLTTLEFYYVEVEDIPLDRLPGLESLTVHSCELLQRLTISSENLRQAHLSSCPDLVNISFSFSEKLESFFVFGCASLATINWLDRMRNLEKLEIQQCNELTDVWGLEHLESLKSLKVRACMSLRRCIDPSWTNIPEDCLVEIQGCGDFFKDSTPSDPPGMPLLRYVQEILLDKSNFESKSDKTGTEGGKKATAWWKKIRVWRTSKESGNKEIEKEKMELPFTIRFHLGVKESSKQLEFVGGITRENEDVTPDSVTYKRLIANVKGFGFCSKRMWYKTPGEFNDLPTEIRSDEQVKGMVQQASKRGLIHLYVEGGVDSEGEYNDQIREMFGEEWRMNTDVYPHDGGAERDNSGPDEGSDSASNFQAESPNAECFEATGNRRQMRDGRIGHCGDVDGGKTVSMEYRKKDKDEIGIPVNQNDVVSSCCQKGEGVEHYERSRKATIEVEDQRDLSHVKRDRTVETDRVPAKTGRGSGTRCASNRGKDPAERGRARGQVGLQLLLQERTKHQIEIKKGQRFNSKKGHSFDQEGARL